MKHKFLTIIILLFSGIISVSALTAEQILANAASKFTKSGAVSATYTFTMNGRSNSGSIKAKSKKFCIETSSAMVCYNGVNLWEYNKAEDQCTLSAPPYSETAQMNPYAILSSYKSAYKASTVKSKIKGTYAIRLTPTASHSPISKATVYIRASDWQPVRLDILDRSGALTTILITSIKVGAPIPDSDFEFNTKQHPGTELIDLR